LVAAGEFREGVVGAGPAAALLDDAQDPLVVLPLAGKTLLEALEMGLQQYPKAAKAFLQVSGMQITFSTKGNGAGGTGRVLEVTIGVRPLAPEKVYRVGMTRTLAVGAFGYFRLWPQGRAAPAERITVGEALRQAPVNGALALRGDRRIREK